MRIILVTAIWCPTCLIMRPRYVTVIKKIPMADFTEFDYDTDADSIGPLKIGKILPVAIVQIDGNEVFRIIGEKSPKALETALDEYITHE